MLNYLKMPDYPNMLDDTRCWTLDHPKMLDYPKMLEYPKMVDQPKIVDYQRMMEYLKMPNDSKMLVYPRCSIMARRCIILTCRTIQRCSSIRGR